MEYFTPDRNLLNPKFEGYRLDLISQEDAVTRYPLEHQLSQATASGRTPLSFQEVQSRITHNHISIAPDSARAVYVDSEYRVILINLSDLDTAPPSFHVLRELPRPIQSGAEAPQYEYPSSAFLSPDTVFVSDGAGLLYIIRFDDPGFAAEIVATHGLESSPFRIHSVFQTGSNTAAAVLSSRCYAPNSALNGGSTRGSARAEFDVWAAHFDLSITQAEANIRPMELLWRRRGSDIPIFSTYHESSKAYLVVGGSVYNDIDTDVPPTYEPSPDEMAPIPRLNENLDRVVEEPIKPNPYSWTQTSDSVTVAIPLPSNTPKSQIKVTFTPSALTLHVDLRGPSSIHIPRFSGKEFWDGISASSSYWTWDREGDQSFGLLTLHLDKLHEGTKWAQVFASSGTLPSSETSNEDVEVPETVDPSELWHIRESLEKYTAALQAGEDPSGLGLGRGVPSLAEGEMDEEVDSSIGRAAYLTWIGHDGSVPPWANSRATSFQLLSTPIPGYTGAPVSFVIKNNLDGTLFSLGQESDPQQGPIWTHASTFSALAFVLASKQDTRFTHHIPSFAVFAFESGTRDHGGNVYIYRATPGKDKWAKQAILQVGGGASSSLLGVGLVAACEKKVFVCLTERELVLLKVN
ncbi:hypothetical protein BD779DRAFT_1466807 [Infundibulicybe gibba]|nr:hypothetical protein BD779DRAFT_1466807 [Infundibulicybe gibba]